MGYDIKGTVSIPAEAWVEFANKFAPSQSAPNTYMNPRIQGGELVFDYQACTEGVQEPEPDHCPDRYRVNDFEMPMRCELADLTTRLQAFLESVNPDLSQSEYADEEKLLRAFNGGDPWVTRDEVNDMVCFAWRCTSQTAFACDKWLLAHPE